MSSYSKEYIYGKGVEIPKIVSVAIDKRLELLDSALFDCVISNSGVDRKYAIELERKLLLSLNEEIR